MRKSELANIVDRMDKAEDLLNSVYWDFRDEKGYDKFADKLDKLLCKLDDLKQATIRRTR